MPGRDRSGPNGYGPLSGRGYGPCGRRGGYGAYGRGRGYGPCGRGYGWGPGWGYESYMPPRAPAVPSKEEETEFLKAELKELEADKKEIEERLKELEK